MKPFRIALAWMFRRWSDQLDPPHPTLSVRPGGRRVQVGIAGRSARLTTGEALAFGRAVTAAAMDAANLGSTFRRLMSEAHP